MLNKTKLQCFQARAQVRLSKERSLDIVRLIVRLVSMGDYGAEKNSGIRVDGHDVLLTLRPQMPHQPHVGREGAGREVGHVGLAGALGVEVL